MLFSWFRKRRRRKLLAQPFPPPWEQTLQQNVWHYAYLSPGQQRRLRERLRVFVAEKEWVGCGELEMTDEIKVTVAAQACLLLLGASGDYCFDNVQTLLVYPGAFLRPPELQSQYGIVDEGMAVHGEAWRRGPVILSWDRVLEDGHYPHDGQNLVLHEFAHQIDALDGDMGGTPPLGSTRQWKRWHDVMEGEFHRLENAVRRGWPTLLDDYGASNRAEFFAVATECFFEQPEPLWQRHPELYDVLRDFYRLNPAEWVT